MHLFVVTSVRRNETLILELFGISHRLQTISWLAKDFPLCCHECKWIWHFGLIIIVGKSHVASPKNLGYLLNDTYCIIYLMCAIFGWAKFVGQSSLVAVSYKNIAKLCSQMLQDIHKFCDIKSKDLMLDKTILLKKCIF